jgi:quercetin dioxygenase-like cupin family protein
VRKFGTWEFLAVAAFVVVAQTPAEQAPDNVKIDSPQARVLSVTEQPGHRSAMHQHPLNRVLIYLDSGAAIETTATGETHKIAFKAGEVRWSPATGPHMTEYIADHPIRLIEIELKNKPQGPAPTSSMDPFQVDTKHYSLEFENDQVRVLRVHYGPHENGVLHEHKLNHIVVYLNDQAKGKAGEVRLDEPATHTEQNPLDHPVERIAIDLK